MTPREARIILASWRETDRFDASDPELLEALALARQDPDLQQWLEQQRAFNRAVRDAVRAVPPPPGLADSLITRRPTSILRFPPPSGWILAAAAGILLLALAAHLLLPRQQDPLDQFRSRMVRVALREYRMDIVTEDIAAIRSYLATREGPASFDLPPALASLTPVGGGALRWQGHPVSMVCLRSQRIGMVYLFVVSSRALQPGAEAIAVQVNRLGTVAWSSGDATFVMAGAASPEELKQLL